MITPKHLLSIVIILLLLTACGAVGDEIVFDAAPWQDGERSEYDVISAQGERVGVTGCLGLIVWLRPSEKPNKSDHDRN